MGTGVEYKHTCDHQEIYQNDLQKFNLKLLAIEIDEFFNIVDTGNTPGWWFPGGVPADTSEYHIDRRNILFNDNTVDNSETKLWANYTDENYNPNQSWHNHETSCTLCGVLYLETVENCGIKLKHDNEITYIEPKKYDLLVFPGFLNHLPIVHKTKRRISLQFEISCIEDINNIWSQK